MGGQTFKSTSPPRTMPIARWVCIGGRQRRGRFKGEGVKARGESKEVGHDRRKQTKK